MNRGKPLARRTPLRARSALKANAAEKPRQPIKPRRGTPRRRARDADDHGGPWHEVRLVIYNRAGGCCELCGRRLTVESMEGHHRRTRRLGPDCPCNALALCADCHHGPDVHGGPEAARAAGRIVAREQREPGDVPVQLQAGRWVELTCGGTYIATDAPAP